MNIKNSLLIVLIVFSMIYCSSKTQKGETKKSTIPITLFEDEFGPESQGEFQQNVVQLPPPEGLGYTWEVLLGGHKPSNWVYSDELELTNPKKGFWVIPADSGYLAQGGRSHNSVLFANQPVPADAVNYDVEFKQKRGDNDPIMYLLGAPEPNWEWTTEIGCEIQVPGTDSTTNNAYVSGALGESVIEGAAFHDKWVSHKIEVRGENVKWSCDNYLMAEGEITGLKPGYFGIRMRYERNTFYDDVKIVVFN